MKCAPWPLTKYGKRDEQPIPGKRDNLFVLEVAFLEEFVKRGEHREIAATGTPRRMVSGDRFLG